MSASNPRVDPGRHAQRGFAAEERREHERADLGSERGQPHAAPARELVAVARTTLDARLFGEIERLYTEDLPVLPLYFPVVVDGERLAVVGTALDLRPLMDDQELDARASTGTIYWEGAVTAFRNAKASGRGYLELTGYWRPMRL